uniref:Fatty acyl-CoA reductase C-terminal domain-containing protein n=1 Tax=Capitella teleta TaxID=283909 RepID=X1YXD3_CAPTE
MAYFTSNQWTFASENITTFAKSLCSEDKMCFNFDITSVNWEEYIVHYCQGIKTYPLKDPMVNVKQARKNQQRSVRDVILLRYHISLS